MEIKNMSEYEGREVYEYWMPDESVGRFPYGSKHICFYHSEYHGDHSENWLVVFSNGIEHSRINTKYVSSIIWK